MCKMDVTELIGLVRERRPIWDQKDYNYKNRDVVRLLWEEVAVQLNRPLDKVRKRWKNLRDMFRNEIKKILLEAGDTLPEEFVSTWTHFEDMVFLKDQIVTKKTLRNLNLTGMELDDSDDNEEMLEIPVSPTDFEDDDDMTGESQEGISLVTREVPVPPTPNLSEVLPSEYQSLDHFLKPPPAPRKRRREPELHTDMQVQVDDDYHFLISFLPSLKQMNYQTKMWFRLKMQELLYTCALNAVTPSPLPPYGGLPRTNGTGSPRELGKPRENGE